MTDQPYVLTPHVFAGLRIKELENITRAAAGDRPAWTGIISGGSLHVYAGDDYADGGTSYVTFAEGQHDSVANSEAAHHIAVNDPAHVLKQCAAYRAIVSASNLYSIPVGLEWAAEGGEFRVRVDGALVLMTGEEFTVKYCTRQVTPELLALCSIWSDHEDYNSDWTVTA